MVRLLRSGLVGPLALRLLCRGLTVLLQRPLKALLSLLGQTLHLCQTSLLQLPLFLLFSLLLGCHVSLFFGYPVCLFPGYFFGLRDP